MLEKEGGCELVDHRCVAWPIIAWERGRDARLPTRSAFAPAELGARADRPQCEQREKISLLPSVVCGTPAVRRTTVTQSDLPKIAFQLRTDC